MMGCVRFYVILLAVIFFAGSAVASRNNVQIDDLLSYTQVEVNTNNRVARSVVSAAPGENILGDIRKLYMATNGTGFTEGSADVQNGEWSSSTNTPTRPGESFISSLVYDGGYGGSDKIVNREGLDPKVNLRLGNAYGFRYTVTTDQDIQFVISVYTDETRFSEARITILANSPDATTGILLYDVDFDDNTGPGGPADFTNVGALAFAKVFISAATDASLSFINAFAEYVSGKVYLDCNQPLCTYDGADTLLSGYTVTLTRQGSNTPEQTFITRADGTYEFFMTNGVYQVCLVTLNGFQIAQCNSVCRTVDVSTPNSPDQLNYDFALTTTFTITPPGPRTIECNKNGVSTSTTQLGSATVNACGNNPPTPTFSDVTSSLCGPNSFAYTITRTFYATQNGNTISATQFIQVTDTQTPVIASITAASVTCLGCTTTACLGVPAVTDQCTNNNFLNPAFSDSNPTGGCTSTFARTWSYTDPCGLAAANVVQQVTIRDNDTPRITAPSSTTVNCGQTGTFGSPQVSDDCTTPSIRTFDQDGSIGCNRVITRFFTADDGCGHTAVTSATITSPSAGSPILDVPEDLETSCQSSLTPTALDSTAVAVDSCVGGSLPVTYRDSGSFSSSSPPYNLGGSCTASFIRTWSVSDACAGTQTGTQVIFIRDTVGPSFTSVVSPITGGCTGNVNGVAPQPIDTCNPNNSVTVTFSDSNPQGDTCTTTVTRTYLATDPCGNQASTSQQLVRTDNTPPTISLPTTSYSVECPASTSPDASNAATASDNCQPSGNIQLTYSDTSVGSNNCVSTFRRTWYANDGCAATATAVQTVLSVDNTPPLITAPGAISVPCTQIESTSNSGTPTVFDNCSPNGVTVTFADISTNGELCPNGITITRRFTAIDACGLRSTSDQAITITKDSLPSITVTPATVEVECNNPNTSTAALATVTSDNSCQVGLSLSVNDSPIPSGCRRTFTRTFTVRDLCGDEASATQEITIVDSSPPVITAPGPITISCVDDLDNIDTGSATVTDNCETGLNQQVVRTQSDQPGQPTDGTCPGDTIRTVTFSVTDACGRQVSATQIITIQTRPIGECIPVDCTPVPCNTDSCPQADCECCGAAATPCSPVNCSPALCTAVDCSPVPCSGCTGSNGNSGCQPRACPPTYVYVNDDDIQGFGKMQEQQTTVNPKVSGASQLVISCLLIAATFSSIFVALF